MSGNIQHEQEDESLHETDHIRFRRREDVVMVQVPRMGGVNDNLHRVTEQTRALSRPANTRKAYDGKREEFIQYLDKAWLNDPLRRVLSEPKVYRFLFYQCAREQRLNRRGQRNMQEEKFDMLDYEQIMQKYDQSDTRYDDDYQPFIQPENGLKFQALRQYKAVIKEYFQKQLEHHTRGWEFIWTPRCEVLLKIVRIRGPEQKLRNFDEKVTHALSPFTIVHRYPEIENKLFHQGMGSMRAAVTHLRNRYVLTHTTSGILRFETLEKACLSDFLCTFIKKEEDVHPLLVMVTQVFTGKLIHVLLTFIIMNYHLNLNASMSQVKPMIPVLFLDVPHVIKMYVFVL